MVASTPMATITTVSMLPAGSLSPGQSPSWAEAGKTQGLSSLVKQQRMSGVLPAGRWSGRLHLQTPEGLNRSKMHFRSCPKCYLFFNYWVGQKVHSSFLRKILWENLNELLGRPNKSLCSPVGAGWPFQPRTKGNCH